jgi:hypothetical protein
MLFGTDFLCLLGVLASHAPKRKTFDFSAFYIQFSKDYPNLKQPSKEFKQLNPYFATGFTDGEGSFLVSIYKDKNLKKNRLMRLSSFSNNIAY